MAGHINSHNPQLVNDVKTMSRSKRLQPCGRCDTQTAVRVALPCGRLVNLCIPCASNFARYLSRRIYDLARAVSQNRPAKMDLIGSLLDGSSLSGLATGAKDCLEAFPCGMGGASPLRSRPARLRVAEKRGDNTPTRSSTADKRGENTPMRINTPTDRLSVKQTEDLPDFMPRSLDKRDVSKLNWREPSVPMQVISPLSKRGGGGANAGRGRVFTAQSRRGSGHLLSPSPKKSKSPLQLNCAPETKTLSLGLKVRSPSERAGTSVSSLSLMVPG